MDQKELLALYTDNQRCAEIIGLQYSSDDLNGIKRRKAGKGWSFTDETGKTITDNRVKERISSLIIPPAWKDVWICPSPNGHILATGVDDKGRKQYVYHPEWRTLRDILNFYKLLSFGEYLPRIRSIIKKQLKREAALDQDQVLGLMLWFLDNSYIRIGNNTYFDENESVGLSTLTRDHIRIKNDVITLTFVGKSSQQHTIELKNKQVATLISKLLRRPGDRIFVTEDGQPYAAEDCNAHLHTITDGLVSAKNFRTWGGTLAAFEYLKKRQDASNQPEAKKVIIQAVDKAAEELGNTRTVARSHYVHPHILEIYARDDFKKLYERIEPRNNSYLTKSENELLGFLELLFQREFDILKSKQTPRN